MRVAALAVLVWTLLGAGCATIFVTIDKWPDPGIYPGTQFDWQCIRGTPDPEAKRTLRIATPFFGSIDLLFSLVADTILLPVHAGLRFGNWLIRDGEEPAKHAEDAHGMPAGA